MTTGVLVALAIVSGAPPVRAQDPPAPALSVAPQPDRPAAPVLSPQQAAAAAQKRRNQIQLMEGLLARAGSVAADSFARRLQQIEPGMAVTIGQSRARGFVLDGYGIFFDVEVPELRGTVIWSQMVMQRELEMGNAIAMLKRAVQDLPDGPSRQQAQQALRLLDLQAGPVQQVQSQGGAVGPGIKVSETSAAADPGVMADSTVWMKDPNKEYRDMVQRELIDAMLDYSLPMDVAPDEWLAVAARVSEAGQRGQTLMMRVKGSDLAIYAADRARRDEIRGKVEVRVF